MWNILFTLLFKSFSERVTGSDSASKLFCTIIYILYHGINLDYGSILWQQLVQSTLSITRHSKISCAWLWSVIIQRAINRLNIPVTKGYIRAAIPILHTSNFIMSDRTKFMCIGSISETMLNYVPKKQAYQRVSKETNIRVWLSSETRGEVNKTTDGSSQQEQKPNSNDPKGNETSRSKGKGQMTDDDDDDEKDEEAQLERQLKRKALSIPNSKLYVKQKSLVFEFALTDLPCLKPFHWISLYHILLKNEQKFGLIMAHIKRMLISYIQDVGKMDMEIAIVLRKKPTVLPKEAPNNISKMRLGKFEKDK
ncbi:unnamed protein product [Lactuca saligna]|uniref:Uncharacterized protein n=1 Tax=Lactuca saligna TaxID=75948 RepID=A0AA35YJS0_LACSI|nr:unnamed protein product [Lactuca saligna]